MTKLLERTMGPLRAMQGAKNLAAAINMHIASCSALLRLVWVFALLVVASLQALLISRRRHNDETTADAKFRKIVTNYCQKFFQHARISIIAPEDFAHPKALQANQQAIYVGNHLSYLDILLLFSFVDASFLAKSEVRSWPLIGLAANIVKTIFVERDSTRGRQHALSQSAKAIVQTQRSIIIFPEGTTSLAGKTWKSGAFRIAQATAVPIVPFRLCYWPLRECAFIDDDALVPHMLRLFRLKHIQASIEFGRAFTVHPEADLDPLIESTRQWVNSANKSQAPLAFKDCMIEKRA